MRRITLSDPADLLWVIDDPEFALSDGLAQWLWPSAQLRDVSKLKMKILAIKSKSVLKQMKEQDPETFSALTGGQPRIRWPKVEYTLRTEYPDRYAPDETQLSAIEALDTVRATIEDFRSWDEIPHFPGHDLYEMEVDNRATSLWVVMLALAWNGEIEFDRRHPIGYLFSSISIRPVALPVVLQAVRQGKPQIQAGDIASHLGLDQMATFLLLENLVRDGQIRRGERYGYSAIELGEEDKRLSA